MYLRASVLSEHQQLNEYMFGLHIFYHTKYLRPFNLDQKKNPDPEKRFKSPHVFQLLIISTRNVFRVSSDLVFKRDILDWICQIHDYSKFVVS